MVGFDCHKSPTDTTGNCNQDKSRALCMRLPPGAIVIGTPQNRPLSGNNSPACRVNEIAVGFACVDGTGTSANCNAVNMRLVCSELKTGTVIWGDPGDTDIAKGLLNCSSALSAAGGGQGYITGMTCYSKVTPPTTAGCNSLYMALTCTRLSSTNTIVD